LTTFLEASPSSKLGFEKGGGGGTGHPLLALLFSLP